jgi:PAS domain-containing protein
VRVPPYTGGRQRKPSVTLPVTNYSGRFPAALDEINTELLRTGRWDGELVHIKANGTQVVVASRWSLQRDERQLPHAILELNGDVTEHKRAEEKLQQSEAQLSEARRLSHTGSFSWKISTGEIVWSEETFRIFQYEENLRGTCSPTGTSGRRGLRETIS